MRGQQRLCGLPQWPKIMGGFSETYFFTRTLCRHTQHPRTWAGQDRIGATLRFASGDNRRCVYNHPNGTIHWNDVVFGPS